MATEGGGFESESREAQVEILFNKLGRGMAVLIPHEDKWKLRAHPVYWPEEVAVLIP